MASELPKRVAENINQFTGRTWLLPKLLKWWNDPSGGRIFLLTGGPGTGKSMILAWLAGFGPEPQDALVKQQLSQLRQAVKAAHFCQAASRNITPQAFAESIANQLTGTVKGFGDALAATLAECVSIVGTARANTAATGSSLTGVKIGRIDLSKLGDELSFDRAFTQPLKKLYEMGHKEPMLLLVDALDEAETYTGVKIPDLLSRLSDLPGSIRILATTRHEQRVLKFFRGIKPFDLIKSADPDVDDVRIYAERRLTELAEKVKRLDFAERLAKQADGVFLYAALVLDDLLEHSIAQLPELATYSLPKGLSGLYHDFLNRELGKYESLWFDVYEPLLGLIAVAQGDGLTAQQLTDIIGKDSRAALRACKQYLSGELPDGPFRPFHKSFADFLLEDEGNVDYQIDSRAMHQRISDHYWSKHHKDWSECDDYSFAHLSSHLYEAAQHDRLADLISPAWMHARVAFEGYRYSGFIAHVRLAWQHAREEGLRQIEVDDIGFDVFAKCFRYALICASINSLSNSYPAELVRRALETGGWSGDRALDVAAHTFCPLERVRMYVVLLHAGKDMLTKAQCDEASQAGLTTARSIKDDYERARALATLVQAPQLDGKLKAEILDEALDLAQAITHEESRAYLLTPLAKQLRGELKAEVLDKALAAMRMMDNGNLRAFVLAELAPQLSGKLKAELLDEALAAAPAIISEWERAQVLTVLAPQLSGEQSEQALAFARSVEDEKYRAEALAALAPRLSEKLKTDVLDEALALVRTIENQGNRAETLARVAPHVSGELKTEMLDEALASAEARVFHTDRAYALAQLAPQLSGEQLERALALVRSTKDQDSRAEALTWLAPQLSGKLKAEVLDEALALLQPGNLEQSARAQTLVALAPQLNGEQLERALVLVRAARAIWQENYRAEALAALALHLSGKLRTKVLDEALALLRSIGDPNDRAEKLTWLAPQLSGKLRIKVLDEALALVRSAPSSFNWQRVRTLAALAPQLSGELKAEVLDEALTWVRSIEDERYRMASLAALAPQLRGDLKAEVLDEALAWARSIEDEGYRAQELAGLASELSGKLRTKVLDEALEAARAIEDEKYRAKALAALAPQLSGDSKAEVLEKALATARGMEDSLYRAQVLAAFFVEADQKVRVREIRRCLVDSLEKGLSSSKPMVLKMISSADLVRAPIVGSETIATLARHIIEISHQWRWL